MGAEPQKKKRELQPVVIRLPLEMHEQLKQRAADEERTMSQAKPRKGMPSPRLSESEFRRRFLAQFADPAYGALAAELDKIAAAAWDAYDHGRKAPRTRKAGAEFAVTQPTINVNKP